MEKIELLAKFLEIEDLDQIEETKYDSDSFSVNPHTKKIGSSPSEMVERINLVKQALDQSGISKIITLEAEDFIPSLYNPISKVFYKTCEDLTKIGLHDLVNTLYFLCGGSKGQELTKDKTPTYRNLMNDYRDLFEGKEIEDTREEMEVSDGEYLVLDEFEAEKRYDDYLDSYIEDCVLGDMPEHLRNYFDYEAFKRDASIDGRGSFLASYDSCENEILDPDTNETFYIYRTN